MLEEEKISKGQIWEKQTDSWQNNDPKGTKVKVCKYDGKGVWHKKSFFGTKYYLNETSFRRIFKLSKME